MNTRHALNALAVIGTSALTALAGVPANASAGPSRAPGNTITSNLDGPFGLDILSSKRALITESNTGEITSVDLRSGAQRTVISGLTSPSGVAAYGKKIYVVLGAGAAEESAPLPAAPHPPASVLVADSRGKNVRVLADLMAYELKNNPDGQVQFDAAKKPYDALSNPFAMVYSKWGLLIADGGANDVLQVNPRTGRISTFFVPPNAKTPECLKAGAQANPGTVGCDSVPTGVAVQGDYVYVSTLGAERPGAAAIWKLDGRTGKLLNVRRGFTSLTGVAVSPKGTLFASEALFGAPAGEGPPPPGFDPSTIGRITRIQGGKYTRAKVTMPTGLEYADGQLYASTWSTASFMGLAHAGKLVRVGQAEFK